MSDDRQPELGPFTTVTGSYGVTMTGDEHWPAWRCTMDDTTEEYLLGTSGFGSAKEAASFVWGYITGMEDNR